MGRARDMIKAELERRIYAECRSPINKYRYVYATKRRKYEAVLFNREEFDRFWFGKMTVAELRQLIRKIKRNAHWVNKRPALTAPINLLNK